jgi:hypothetical protein
MARGLPPEQVAHIKRALLAGAAPAALARLYGLNVETVRRYGRGESRSSVVVEGEEAARPQNPPLLPEDGEARESLETLKKLLENSDGTTSLHSSTSPSAAAFLDSQNPLRELQQSRNLPADGNFLNE